MICSALATLMIEVALELVPVKFTKLTLLSPPLAFADQPAVPPKEAPQPSHKQPGVIASLPRWDKATEPTPSAPKSCTPMEISPVLKTCPAFAVELRKMLDKARLAINNFFVTIVPLKLFFNYLNA